MSFQWSINPDVKSLLIGPKRKRGHAYKVTREEWEEYYDWHLYEKDGTGPPSWFSQDESKANEIRENFLDLLLHYRSKEDKEAWDKAAKRAPDVLTIAGATGPWAQTINGTYDRVPTERMLGDAPVYKKRTGPSPSWLFFASNIQWIVGTTKDKNERHNAGWAVFMDVEHGMLPHEVRKGAWKVLAKNSQWPEQPAMRVTVPPPISPDLDVPPTWEKQCNSISNYKTYKEVDLVDVNLFSGAGYSEEAQMIVGNHFDVKHGQIKKIQRIQNCPKWEMYSNAKKMLFNKLEGGDVNERFLWHGTSQTNPLEIVNSECGLDDRYSMHKSFKGYYGCGIYLAERARYSNGDQSKKYYFQKGSERQLLLVRAICGRSKDYWTSIAEQLIPGRDLVIPNSNKTLYDSVLAGPHRPHHAGPGENDSKFYVLYERSHVYAEYLVTYTICPQNCTRLPIRRTGDYTIEYFHHGKWIRYDPSSENQINEQIKEKKSSPYTLNILDQTYEIDIQKLTQTNVRTKYERPIRFNPPLAKKLPPPVASVGKAAGGGGTASSQAVPAQEDLIKAAIKGSVEEVNDLLKAKPDVNAKSNFGETALIIATRDGRTDLVDLLLKANADVDATDNEGKTALMWASFNDHTDIVERLIKANADVNAKSNFGSTALMLASKQEILALLLKAASSSSSAGGGGTAQAIKAPSKPAPTHHITVSGAGSQIINGVYKPCAYKIKGKTCYKQVSEQAWYIQWSGTGWYISRGNTGSWYYVQSVADVPPETGWMQGTGLAPVPTVKISKLPATKAAAKASSGGGSATGSTHHRFEVGQTYFRKNSRYRIEKFVTVAKVRAVVYQMVTKNGAPIHKTHKRKVHLRGAEEYFWIHPLNETNPVYASSKVE